jgi:arylformamidase
MLRFHSRRSIQSAASILLAAIAAFGLSRPVVAADPPATSSEKKSEKERPSQAAVLAKNTEAKLDIPYGTDEKQRLDLYLPQGAKDAPIVIFVHGGEWSRHDKAEVSYKPKFLNEHGVIFSSINYRLSPPAKHPDHVDDVASAIRWMRDHAKEFGGDPQKIFLMGHSAGCHLVTLVTLDPRYLAKVDLRPADVRGVVAWSGGAYDLVQKVNDGGMYADYIKKAFGDPEDAWRDASPVNHAKDAQNGPRFLFISIKPGDASNKAAERLAGLIREGKGNAEAKLIVGRDHFDANHLLGAPEDTTGQILLDFIQDAAK